MTLQEKIKQNMVQAMRDKNAIKITALRGLMASFTNELVAKKKKPDEMLSDEEAVTVISRAIKQRKDSVEQFKKGGRTDLVECEETELKIIEEYAPKLMAKNDILTIAQKKKSEMGITDKSKMGQLMSALMKDLKGQALGGDVKSAVESLF